ncbi:MAG: hypothetical protein BGP10_12495 [Rhodanobacter sp. 68-29]|nr:MAG: hypothetical protein BGP10_12495 [Rhodanobacter sp. 68-29]
MASIAQAMSIAASKAGRFFSRQALFASSVNTRSTRAPSSAARRSPTSIWVGMETSCSDCLRSLTRA